LGRGSDGFKVNHLCISPHLPMGYDEKSGESKYKTMTVTNVQISPESQAILIKTAALHHVSVEEMASKILGEGIQAQLSKATPSLSKPETSVNPLSDLQPYAYLATPEESVLPDDQWDMEG
jgi:hypothetical protein